MELLAYTVNHSQTFITVHGCCNTFQRSHIPTRHVTAQAADSRPSAKPEAFMEVSLSIIRKERVAYLRGDWTVTALTKEKIELLADVLQQTEDGHCSKLQVDCRDMTTTDRAGLELLQVWLQCARLRGLEPELINLPDQIKRSFIHENRRNQGHRQAA